MKLHSKPFVLSGFKTIFPKVDVPTPTASGYITRMDAWLVDKRDRRVSIRDVMLHHLVFINRRCSSPGCGACSHPYPYVGRAVGLTVDVPQRLEVADHVLPGVPVVAIALFLLGSGSISLPLAASVALPGVWMTTTHVGLVGSAFEGVVTFPAALNMFIPSLAIVIIAVALVAAAWDEP